MSAQITEGWISNEANGIRPDHSLECSKWHYSACESRKVSYVVMHYTGNDKDTARANANFFHNKKQTDPKSSAHFFVDDNSIFQSVKLKDIAWHCGTNKAYYNDCRNDRSIGIEMCTSGGGSISKKTEENAAALCACICKIIGIKKDQVDTCVVRHYDVTHKDCPKPMVDDHERWIAFRQKVKKLLPR